MAVRYVKETDLVSEREHLIFDSIGEETPLPHRQHVVQPGIARVAGFEARLREKIGFAKFGLAIAGQRRTSGFGDMRTTEVLHVDMRTVVGEECRAHIEMAKAVGVDQQPVTAAGQNLACQAGTLEATAGHFHNETVTMGACADWRCGTKIGVIGHEWFELHRELLKDAKKMIGRGRKRVEPLKHKQAGLREWGAPCCWLLLVACCTLRPVLASETCTAGPGAATESVVARYGAGLDFEVYRNDRAVGRHEARFSRENGYLVVRSMLDLGIKLLFIEAYHYRYEATEYWCDNQLMRLAATVNDDGKRSEVSAIAEQGRLRLNAPDGSFEAPAGSFATNHWHPGVLASSAVINTLTGHLNRVQLKPCAVPAPSGEQTARCVDYTGDLQARVWYDDTGRWRGLAFAGTDGSRIDYRLRDSAAIQSAQTDP